MGLFDLFEKKEKTYICARCKKEITEDETKWIGNHRFCDKCAVPPKVNAISNRISCAASNELTLKKNNSQPYKKVIHSAGAHVMGELYEEVNVEICDGKYYYATLSMTDRFNAGGHREEIPKDFFVNGKLDEDALLDYIAVTHTYMETLSHRKNSAKLCYICKKPLKNANIKKINNHLLCEICFDKINN